MITPTLTDALAELRAADPTLGDYAETAFNWLVGEDDDVRELAQGRVQEFLWYALPRKFLVPEGEEAELYATMREALARVFARLGLERLAAVCRAAPTLEVHAAYVRSEDEGLEAARLAAAASGLEPPDLDDFAWGDMMGMVESDARDLIERALEHAIDAGTLVPGRRGWEAEQRRVATVVLDAPYGGAASGRSLREEVLVERVDRWALLARPRLAELRRRAAPALEWPVAPPEGLAEALDHLTWFLRAAEAGIKLTERGNLNRAFVQAAAVERGWQAAFTPSREWDVPLLERLHELARELSAVRRSKGTLRTTAKGRRYGADPEAAWRALVDHFAVADDGEALGLEVLALMLLDGDGVTSLVPAGEMLNAVFGEAGIRWVDPSPLRSDDDRARGLLLDLRHPFEVLGLAAWVFGDWPDVRVTATPVGVATLTAVLRARATRPLG